jgi:starch synthase (maltosyl-transferring)
VAHEHPEWFQRRPDGTLKYAENPPKKYQDIYNVDWDSEDWRGLWQALHDVVMHWVDLGVHVFRVDNPHTKPLAFWEWLIAEVRAKEPDVIFLAEAFTKAAMMRTLAAVGFNQSYTYFTWKSSRHELTEYIVELGLHRAQPHLPAELLRQHAGHPHGGAPARRAARVPRAARARGDAVAVLRHLLGLRALRERRGAPGLGGVPRLGEVRDQGALARRAAAAGDRQAQPPAPRHPALQRLDTVRFFPTENEALIGYTKVLGDDAIVVVVNIDPRTAQEGVADVPVEAGLPSVFHVRDAVSEQEFDWVTGPQLRAPGPGDAHVLEVLR